MDDFSFLVLLVVCARRLVRLVGWFGFRVGGGIALAAALSGGGDSGGAVSFSFGFGDEPNNAFGDDPADDPAKSAADNQAGNVKEIVQFSDKTANFSGWINVPALHCLGGFRADGQADF